MARRKTASVQRTSDVVVVTPPAPLAKRSSPRRRSRRRSRSRGRRRVAGSEGSYKNKLIGTAIGGLGYGLIDKHYGSSIPTLPVVGKSGTIAIACYFLGAKHPLIKDIGVAAAAIAGYSFGKEGRVSGEADYYEHGLAQE